MIGIMSSFNGISCGLGVISMAINPLMRKNNAYISSVSDNIKYGKNAFSQNPDYSDFAKASMIANPNASASIGGTAFPTCLN